MNVLGWIWIAVIVIAVVVEALTTELVSIWFVPAAIVCVLLNALGVAKYWQYIAFCLVSIAGIVFYKTVISPHVNSGRKKTNLDAIVGAKCIVTEKIDNLAGCGQAKVNGLVWSARSVNDEVTFDEGEHAQIIAIEGVKLICKKINEKE